MLVPMSKERFVFKMLSDIRARERAEKMRAAHFRWDLADYLCDKRNKARKRRNLRVPQEKYL